MLDLEQKYGGLIRGDSIVIVASDGLDTVRRKYWTMRCDRYTSVALP